jgi:hypothetical protein
MTGLIYLLIAIYSKYPRKKTEINFKPIGEEKHEVFKRSINRTIRKL